MYIFVGDMAHPAWHVNSELVDKSLQNGPEKESGLMWWWKGKNKPHPNVRNYVNMVLNRHSEISETTDIFGVILVINCVELTASTLRTKAQTRAD